MNFAVKLSAELRSVLVFSRYDKLSDKNLFLDQPNTFCFMNFALKLSAELRSDQKK
jgi:hypothetical protein